jgi:hypothetical protein
VDADRLFHPSHRDRAPSVPLRVVVAYPKVSTKVSLLPSADLLFTALLWSGSFWILCSASGLGVSFCIG